MLLVVLNVIVAIEEEFLDTEIDLKAKYGLSTIDIENSAILLVKNPKSDNPFKPTTNVSFSQGNLNDQRRGITMSDKTRKRRSTFHTLPK
jgi:uncharacterized protein YjdB